MPVSEPLLPPARRAQGTFNQRLLAAFSRVIAALRASRQQPADGALAELLEDWLRDLPRSARARGRERHQATQKGSAALHTLLIETLELLDVLIALDKQLKADPSRAHLRPLLSLSPPSTHDATPPTLQ